MDVKAVIDYCGGQGPAFVVPSEMYRQSTLLQQKFETCTQSQLRIVIPNSLDVLQHVAEGCKLLNNSNATAAASADLDDWVARTVDDTESIWMVTYTMEQLGLVALQRTIEPTSPFAKGSAYGCDLCVFGTPISA